MTFKRPATFKRPPNVRHLTESLSHNDVERVRKLHFIRYALCRQKTQWKWTMPEVRWKRSKCKSFPTSFYLSWIQNNRTDRLKMHIPYECVESRVAPSLWTEIIITFRKTAIFVNNCFVAYTRKMWIFAQNRKHEFCTTFRSSRTRSPNTRQTTRNKNK